MSESTKAMQLCSSISKDKLSKKGKEFDFVDYKISILEPLKLREASLLLINRFNQSA